MRLLTARSICWKRLLRISIVRPQYNADRLRHERIKSSYAGIVCETKELKMEIAELDSLIDDLSIYMQSTGRKYADHAATLRSWSARKKRQQKPGAGIPDYTYNKEESL